MNEYLIIHTLMGLMLIFLFQALFSAWKQIKVLTNMVKRQSVILEEHSRLLVTKACRGEL